MSRSRLKYRVNFGNGQVHYAGDNANRHTLRATRYLLIADYGRVAYWYEATDYSLGAAARTMRAIYPGATIYAAPDDRIEADAIGLPVWE